MSKFRYLIEHGRPEKLVTDELEIVEADLYITTITLEDDSGSSGLGPYFDLDAAKVEVETWVKQQHGDEIAVKWKDPPQAWQPDAVAVTQYFDDGVEENRDD
jgi:hypothetical protein